MPNTVEGQAVLDNISRTQRVLRYRDNDKVISKIMRGMPYYEVEKQEQVGEESENLVIRGECLSACAYLKEQGIKVDLVYIDPPFASGADYAKKVHIRRNPKLAEKIKKAEEELEIEELKEFEETMYGDIWQKEDYLNWMYENLMAIKSILSESGTIYLHIDGKIGHYVKILMDEVFGEENFRNEIIWHYDIGTAPKTDFKRKHDTIFRYSKNHEEIVFNIITINAKNEDRYDNVDDNGRKYMVRGDTGKIVYSDEGQKEDDVWTYYKSDEFRTLNSMAKERTEIGYSTQKPEALVQRIVNASSNEFIENEDGSKRKMIVADFSEVVA